MGPRRLGTFSFAIAWSVVSARAGAQPAEPSTASTAAPSNVEVTGGARSVAFGSSHFAGVSGRLVLSAERIASVSSWGWTIDATQGTNTVTLEASGTSAGLLWAAQSRVPADAIDAINPFATPRIALDVFVLPNITIGGSLGYASTTASARVTAPKEGEEITLPTSSTLVFAPRLGAAFSVSEWISFWLRGGITYSRSSIDQDSKTNPANDPNPVPMTSLTWSQTTVSLDPVLVVTPTSHFGFIIGPTLDIPVDDSIDVSGPTMGTMTTDVHLRLSNYGVAAGVMGYF